MRKSLIVLTLLAATIFALGYVIGQIRGVGISSAAGSTPIQQWTGFGAHLDGNGLDNHVRGPHAGGKVTAVSGNTITVQPFTDRDGQTSQVTTITLTSTTQYSSGQGQSATKSAIKVGTYVRAEGTLSSDGKTLTATQVFVSTTAPTYGTHAGHGAIGPHADGTVSSVNGDTITVKADNDPSGSTE